MSTKTLFVTFSVGCMTFLSTVLADSPEALPKEVLIEKMQKGGLVLYIRHASTEKDYADQVQADVNDGSTQRVLSEEGWHEAVRIGKAFHSYGIPVEKVISSEYFRAWQTAWLAFGEYEKNADFNFLPHEDYTEEQVLKMKERVTPYLATMPAGGKKQRDTKSTSSPLAVTISPRLPSRSNTLKSGSKAST